MAPASTRAPRLPPQARRRQILQATAAFVAREGFEALTLEAIAREAGVTRPVVYDQFGDLAGLLDAFLGDTEERALAAAGGALPDPGAVGGADELLRQAMATFLTAVKSDPDLWRIVLIPPEGTPAEARGLVDRRRRELTAEIADLIAAILDRQELLPGVDREVLAGVLVGIAEDMGRLILRKPKRFAVERIADACAQAARLVEPGPEPA